MNLRDEEGAKISVIEKQMVILEQLSSSQHEFIRILT